MNVWPYQPLKTPQQIFTRDRREAFESACFRHPHRPTEADAQSLCRLYPSADPMKPDWARIRAKLIAEGRSVAEVEALTALDLLAIATKSGSRESEKPKRRTIGKRLKDKPLTDRQRKAFDTLVECNGNKTETARRLGISRSALDDRLKGIQLRGELSKNRSVSTRQQIPADARGQLIGSAGRKGRARYNGPLR